MLTGTPLQNNVDELFSLLNFLEPAQFPSQVAFLMEFGDLKTEAQVEKLKQVWFIDLSILSTESLFLKKILHCLFLNYVWSVVEPYFMENKVNSQQ